jgi:hypothetical protein
MTSWKAEGSYKQHSDRFMKRLMLRCSYKVQLYQACTLGSHKQCFLQVSHKYKITSCVKMLWCEEKCAQDFGWET